MFRGGGFARAGARHDGLAVRSARVVAAAPSSVFPQWRRATLGRRRPLLPLPAVPAVRGTGLPQQPHSIPAPIRARRRRSPPSMPPLLVRRALWLDDRRDRPADRHRRSPGDGWRTGGARDAHRTGRLPAGESRPPNVCRSRPFHRADLRLFPFRCDERVKDAADRCPRQRRQPE